MGKSAHEAMGVLRRARFACAVMLALAGASAVGGCTIERTRGMGDPCLLDRECIDGLRCIPGPDNRTACGALSMGLPDAVTPPRDAAPETTAPTDAMAPGDAGVSDGAREGGVDASPIEAGAMDAAHEGGADAGVDASVDAGVDATSSAD